MSNQMSQQLDPSEPPYFTVSLRYFAIHQKQFDIVAYSKIGEMLLKAIMEANSFFEQLGLPQRFSQDSKLISEYNEVYMARKNGEPKSDYPSKSRCFFSLKIDFELDMTIQHANVKQNRFCVVFSEKAVIMSGQVVHTIENKFETKERPEIGQ